MRKHIAPFLGRRTFTEFTWAHVGEWLNGLQDNDVSATRARYARVVLRVALNDAMDFEKATSNVALVKRTRRQKSASKAEVVLS